jgi:hypothetical protein
MLVILPLTTISQSVAGYGIFSNEAINHHLLKATHDTKVFQNVFHSIYEYIKNYIYQNLIVMVQITPAHQIQKRRRPWTSFFVSGITKAWPARAAGVLDAHTACMTAITSTAKISTEICRGSTEKALPSSSATCTACSASRASIPSFSRSCRRKYLKTRGAYSALLRLGYWHSARDRWLDDDRAGGRPAE